MWQEVGIYDAIRDSDGPAEERKEWASGRILGFDDLEVVRWEGRRLRCTGALAASERRSFLAGHLGA